MKAISVRMTKTKHAAPFRVLDWLLLRALCAVTAGTGSAMRALGMKMRDADGPSPGIRRR